MKRFFTTLIAAAIIMPAIAQQNQIIKELCDMPEARVTFVAAEFSGLKTNWRPNSENGGTYIIRLPVSQSIKQKVNALLSDKKYKLVMKTKRETRTTTQLVVKNSSDEVIESLMIEERPDRYEIIYEE